MVRASDSQCRSRNCPGFDPSILWHSGKSEEPLMKQCWIQYTEKKTKKIPLLNMLPLWKRKCKKDQSCTTLGFYLVWVQQPLSNSEQVLSFGKVLMSRGAVVFVGWSPKLSVDGSAMGRLEGGGWNCDCVCPCQSVQSRPDRRHHSSIQFKPTTMLLQTQGPLPYSIASWQKVRLHNSKGGRINMWAAERRTSARW